jgi:putative ABC transport system substrate-binding protein
MQRREFITLIGGAAAWPLAARTQQPQRMRRIGVLVPYDENDPVVNTRASAFTQALADMGWTEGRNMRMDLRAGGDINRIRRKFWVPVGRVDNAYGDKNLVCSCLPVDAY